MELKRNSRNRNCWGIRSKSSNNEFIHIVGYVFIGVGRSGVTERTEAVRSGAEQV